MVHKLKFIQFDLVILHEDYQSVPFLESPVYHYIIQLPMSQRRHFFLALVGEEFKSTNNMEAFSLSVNVVINERDLDKSKIILKKTIADNNYFYKIFKESLKANGKV